MSFSLVSLARRHIPRTLLPDVAIHGWHGASWNEAVDAKAKVWDGLVAAGIAQPAVGEPRWWRKRVVVPLMEPHIASMPGGCYALVPDPEAMSVLADKAEFGRYAAAIGASHLLPGSIDLKDPTFPAILKRTNLNAGNGVAFVASQQELDEKLGAAPWVGEKVLLQEVIAARQDLVTYVVCVRGRIVWHCSYTYPLADRREIRGPVEGMPMRRIRTRTDDLRIFESILRPLRFNGPANFDYRRRRDGSIAIVEVNPRLGGSLMKLENVRDLAGALRAIVRHARWRPATKAAVVDQEVRV